MTNEQIKITNLENQIEKLQKQLQLHRRIAENTLESILVLTPDLKIKYANKYAAITLQKADKDLIGQDIKNIFLDYIFDQTLLNIQKINKDNRTQSFEFPVSGKKIRSTLKLQYPSYQTKKMKYSNI